MNASEVLALALQFFKTAMLITGPFVAASLASGVAVGVLQTATQINEPSVSYVVKVIAVVGTFAVLGPMCGAEAVRYTRASFEAIATVVK